MRVFRALFISIGIHLLLLFLIAKAPSDLNLKQQFDTAEVEILTPDKQLKNAPDSKAIVRQALAPDKIKITDPSDTTLARFLSEQTQRVKKETRAATTGLTENRNGNDPRTQDQQTSQSSSQSEKRNLDKEGFQKWTPEGAPTPRRNQNTSGGASTIGESLPTDVALGSFTALNTDRYTYYTFYARIDEMIRFRWVSRVQQAINNFDRATAINLGGKSWITSAEFLLSPDGKLKSVLVMKESGIKKFDIAATDAFREAAIFPNPPKELIQDDGYIHLKYNFTVNYDPNLLR